MHKYIVQAIEHTSPSTVLITLGIKSNELPFAHRPGQYAAINFYKHGRPTPVRCFSIVSSPTELDVIQFAMRTRGRFTRGIAGINVGDKVAVEGPYGGFIYHSETDGKAAFLAGGIGITPFMSMIRFATHERLTNEIRLLYSCPSQDDIPFFEELLQHQKDNSHFKVLFFIGQGPTDKLNGQTVYEGRISPDILETVADSDFSDKPFYICGPPPFMKGMVKLLQQKGSPSSRIITEAFSQGPNRQTGKIRSWPANVYIMGTLGVVAATFAVTLSDLLKTLPPSTYLPAPKSDAASANTNSRQQDLDQLVNGLRQAANTAPQSPAIDRANVAANNTATNQVATPAQQAPVKTNQATSSRATPTQSSTPAQSATTTQTAAPAPAPTQPAATPAPTPVVKTPVCTTSPSGVTTCK